MTVEAEFIHKITVEEYERMGELGVLDPRRRYELLEGMILDVSPQNDPHVYAVTRLNEIFVLGARGRFAVHPQVPAMLGECNMPEPDVMLVRRDVRGRAQSSDILLIAEVSDSTYRLDSGTKLRRYAASGIPEYWIVNLREHRIEVYRRPDGWTYAESMILSNGETATPEAFSDIAVSPNDLSA
jgi:Uma2 family endonuclease